MHLNDHIYSSEIPIPHTGIITYSVNSFIFLTGNIARHDIIGISTSYESIMF